MKYMQEWPVLLLENDLLKRGVTTQILHRVENSFPSMFQKIGTAQFTFCVSYNKSNNDKGMKGMYTPSSPTTST